MKMVIQRALQSQLSTLLSREICSMSMSNVKETCTYILVVS